MVFDCSRSSADFVEVIMKLEIYFYKREIFYVIRIYWKLFFVCNKYHKYSIVHNKLKIMSIILIDLYKLRHMIVITLIVFHYVIYVLVIIFSILIICHIFWYFLYWQRYLSYRANFCENLQYFANDRKYTEDHNPRYYIAECK